MAAAAAAGAACGGGPGESVPVAAVVITTGPVSFAALGRTAQFSAEARDAAGVALPGRGITWASSNVAVATVSAAGVVTAAGNGTASITAASEGRASPGVTVTVQQVAAAVAVAPASVSFGAIGSMRALAGAVRDSAGAAIPGLAVVWSRAGPGTTADVSAAGVVTAVGNGAADTAVASFAGPPGALTARAPIAVQQVAATIAVASAAGAAPDTLFTTGRTRQFAATVADSNGNAMGAAAVSWSSTAPAVATVDANGLVTAVADGATQIRAAAGAIAGTRALIVRRFPAVLTLSPDSGAIATNAGTLALSGSAEDSAGAALPLTWISRTPAVAFVSSRSGAAVTATGLGNGIAFIEAAAGSRADTVTIVVSGQTAPAVRLSTDVQPIFTVNCAGAGCHAGPNAAGGLNLSSGAARQNLVNVAALGFPGAVRVIAGDPELSYLIRKLEDRDIAGSPMPDGQAPLSFGTIQIIRNWIAQGAPNN